jgi:hypothetical protein
MSSDEAKAAAAKYLTKLRAGPHEYHVYVHRCAACVLACLACLRPGAPTASTCPGWQPGAGSQLHCTSVATLDTGTPWTRAGRV